jgi:DNA-binding transcriptional LysR family regulator
MIDVRRLKVLQAVVETGSVAAAAIRLNYTPSAVSQQMSTLERETGVQLLERVGRGVRPTEAALLLCEHTSRVFASIKDAEDALVALRAGQSGRLRLGSFPSASSSLIPGALAAFRVLHPHVVLEFVVAEPDEVLTGVREGLLDVAVTTMMTAPSEFSDGLDYHYLLSDEYRVVLPRTHSLSSTRNIDLESLATENWVGVSSCPNHCQRVVEDACEVAGFRPTYALEADEYPTALGFVAAGIGVALVPLLALGDSLRGDVSVHRVNGAQPVRHVWAVTRPSLSDQIPIRAMLSCLEDGAKQSQLAS